MTEYLGNGVYRIGTAQRLWSVRSKKLDAASLPTGLPSESSFGWLRGTALPEPPDHGCYVVEFLPNHEVKVLAYVDWFGRAFSVSEVIAQPPARQEDMFLAMDPGNGTGTLFVYGENDEPLSVASLVKHGRGKSSKFDLTRHGTGEGKTLTGLHYFDMMAQAYLAYVYGPVELGLPRPMTKDTVLSTLRTEPFAVAFNSVEEHVQAIRSNDAIGLNPAIELLAQWLADAGSEEFLAHPDAAANLDLVRTISYADIFFLRVKDWNAPTPSQRMIWGLEGALNRFLHLTKTFDPNAFPSREQCIDADVEFVEGFASQEPRFEAAEEYPEGALGGQWQTRLRISAGIENLAAPFRLETRFRYDHRSGEALFDFVSPCDALFSDSTSEASHIVGSAALTPAERAKRYAMHAGLFYAVVAFTAAPRMQRVRIIGRPIPDSLEFGIVSPNDDVAERPWFDVVFTREMFEKTNGWAEERSGNPTGSYDKAAAPNVFTTVPPFDGLDPLLDFMEERMTLGELLAPASEELERTWAASTRKDTTIEHNIEHQIAGRAVAESVSQCADAAQAIKLIRDAQETIPERLDGRPSEPAFLRLMEVIAQGDVDPHDKDAVALCFQGIDPLRSTYLRAQELIDAGEKGQAVKLLAESVAHESEEDLFDDDATTAYRVFDDYGSRLAFDLIRAQRLEGIDLSFDIAQKDVELAPDCLYLSLNRLVELLEDTFDGSEDAIRYGKAAVTLAPTVGLGYRLLARAYMLIGDFESATETLQQSLQIMLSSGDIAVAYYQLAYVLWQAGKPKQGAVCYAKAIIETSDASLAETAAEELKRLCDETNVTLPEPGEVDQLLDEAGIVVAPMPARRDVLFEGAAAAMDEGLLPAARALLVLIRSTYTADDVLVGVVRSLMP